MVTSRRVGFLRFKEAVSVLALKGRGALPGEKGEVRNVALPRMRKSWPWSEVSMD
jgi:hypothetical protein